jgi:MFS family permease
MMGGDAAMVVALADSLFFDIDLDAARSRVMLFLALSFAPYLFIAPLIGPLVDRIAGGRRLVIQVVALARMVLMGLMATYIDALALFPLVFASLVLQKTYIVSKSALVPSVVRTPADLVEANSKLGLISGLTGAVAVVPAAALLQIGGAPATLVYGGMIFLVALIAASRLAPDVVAEHAPDAEEERELHSPRLLRGSLVMIVLRAGVGYTLFHLAFIYRADDDAGTFWFAAAVALAAVSTMIGNVVAPRLRRRTTEERMLLGSLVLAAVGALVAASFGGFLAGAILAGILNFAAALARLSFESIVQHDAPGANQGRAFATFETRFQLAWVLAAFVAVAVPLPGAAGYLVVAIGTSVAVLQLVITHRQRVRATARARRSRSASETPPRR